MPISISASTTSSQLPDKDKEVAKRYEVTTSPLSAPPCLAPYIAGNILHSAESIPTFYFAPYTDLITMRVPTALCSPSATMASMYWS